MVIHAIPVSVHTDQTNHGQVTSNYSTETPAQELRKWLLGSVEKCVRESTCTGKDSKYLEYPSPSIGPEDFVGIQFEIRVNLRLSDESMNWWPNQSWFEFISILTMSVYSFSSFWDSDHRLIHPSWLCWIWALVKSQSRVAPVTVLWGCKVGTCQCKAWKLRRNPRHATSIIWHKQAKIIK